MMQYLEAAVAEPDVSAAIDENGNELLHERTTWNSRRLN
jgi:hypothetical protein